MRALQFALAIGAWLAASGVHAHGPQMQITRDGNKITTRRLLREEPYSSRLTAPTSLYVIPLLETEGIWYSRPNNKLSATVPGFPEYLSGPGIAYGFDQADGGPRAITAGQHFELQLIDGLKWWNGTGFVDPGLEEVEAFRSSGAPAVTKDLLTPATPAVLSLSNVSASYNSGAHSSVSFRLLEAPPNAFAPSNDGVYLLSMTYANSEPELDASEPFHFLLHKNASAADIVAAVSGMNVGSTFVQFVPEPGTTGLLVAAAASSTACRRSNGRRRQR